MVDLNKSSPLKLLCQNESKLGMEHLWKVLYKDCTFCPVPVKTMAATGKSPF
jgi:hypothetical protein